MYPKTIELKNGKLKELLTRKGDLITVGRTKSEEIEALEKQMELIDLELQEKEKKVDITDLKDKQNIIVERVNEAIAEMETIKKEIFDRMIKQVSAELRTQYDELRKKKEDLEIARNKIALKAQKYNDKIIPLGKELMKPFLEDQFDDYDSLYLDNGEIYATIFNHLSDFKNNFKKK